MKLRAPLFLLLSALLAVGPVGTYAHALQHLRAAGAGHAEDGGGDPVARHPGHHGHHHRGDRDGGHAHGGGDHAPHEGDACELFGAHAPLGAAAPVAGLPPAAAQRPPAPAAARFTTRARETRLPYFPTGPPSALPTN